MMMMRRRRRGPHPLLIYLDWHSSGPSELSKFGGPKQKEH
jgi:hypothetical protein